MDEQAVLVIGAVVDKVGTATMHLMMRRRGQPKTEISSHPNYTIYHDDLSHDGLSVQCGLSPKFGTSAIPPVPAMLPATHSFLVACVVSVLPHFVHVRVHCFVVDGGKLPVHAHSSGRIAGNVIPFVFDGCVLGLAPGVLAGSFKIFEA
jgi:hypothetical protein